MRFATPVFLFQILAAGPAAADRTLVYEPAPVRSLPPEDKRWALLIGVDEYADKQMSGLQGASNDARSLAKLLVERSGFREDHIVVLASNAGDSRKPTRSEILFRLGNVLQQVPRDGLFLLSFSGHGMERGGRAFLLPSDARLSDDLEILQQISLDVDTLRQLIARQGIQQVLILLDACRNDPGGRANAPNPLAESFVRGFNFSVRNKEVQAFATLYSTAVGDRAWEDKEKGLGYFTWAIGEALSGRAANERGEITLASLVRYVQEAVPLRVARDLGPGKRQRPFARIEGYRAEELVLGVAPRLPASPAAQTDDEAVYWKQCEDRGELFCRIYLQRFPEGRFAPLAKALGQSAERPAASPAPSLAAGAPQRPDTPPGVAQAGGKEHPQAVAFARPPDAPAAPKEPAAAPSLRQPGERRRNSRDRQTYVWVPPGRFVMGCAGNGCDAAEQPSRAVYLPKGFWIGQTETTVDAYRKFRAATKAPALPDRDQRGMLYNEAAGDGKLPAVAVTWDEARRYCAWAGMRLPTEAEWEYAAAAGAPLDRSSLADAAWYGGNAGQARIDSDSLWRSAGKPAEYYQRIARNGNGPKPVGQKRANAWGLHDMLGNAWEWVADWYDPHAYRVNQAVAPRGPDAGQQRVVRGGGWLEPGAFVTHTRRSSASPETRATWVGFRCAGETLP